MDRTACTEPQCLYKGWTLPLLLTNQHHIAVHVVKENSYTDRQKFATCHGTASVRLLF